MIAHQYRIRAEQAEIDPRQQIPTLDNCTVGPISYVEAKGIILRYEWLGTMCRPMACYGLLGPDLELLGAACFGGAYNQRTLIPGVPKVCLARGACTHFAPPNAASFLIRHACRLAHRKHGWEVFMAYGDPDAGEIGTVYQAVGWKYLGRGRGHGDSRVEWRMPGSKNWVSSRNLASKGFTGVGCWSKARRAGWVSRNRPSKHEYIWIEGRRRQEFLAEIINLVKPYPKRLHDVVA